MSAATDCTRCGHSSDDHRKDDSDNVDVTSPEAKFRCLGPGWRLANAPGCDCPDFAPAPSTTEE